MEGEGTLGRGHGNGGRGLRRQRSLEWRERRGYGPSAQSSSDDEDNSRHAVTTASASSTGRGARSPGQVLASLLAQQYGSVGDRSYRTGSDTEGAATTDNPTTPFPTPPPTLTPNHRQASPFPLESTNSRRHHYNGSISSDRSRNGNGEAVYAAPSKKTSTGGGTLGRRTRRGHASALSSSSTASDRSETVFPDEHSRMHLTNDTGRDSPPEPAPPEVPPRGPSLHATHTLRSQQNRNGCPPNVTGNFTVPTEQMQTEKYSGRRWKGERTKATAVDSSVCQGTGERDKKSESPNGRKIVKLATMEVLKRFFLTKRVRSRRPDKAHDSLKSAGIPETGR
ncbi:hypothetical protein WN55_07767 [Dufourea novaeangliae]|uniref:Uncharacterized protein n=1 Tax=Dufourea novaeangliae TaxID=178035 RepID=A0A154P4Q7_DUFNO|nr:hypothetical protein WN55_07767 [Dufourea novaeangliae]